MSDGREWRYREATERLLGSFDTGQSLHDFFAFASELAPLAGLSLHFADANSGVLETLAVADADSASVVDRWTALAPKARAQCSSVSKPQLHWVEDLQQHDLLGPIAREAHLGGAGSVLLVPVQDGLTGVLAASYSCAQPPPPPFIELLEALVVPLAFLFNTKIRLLQLETLEDVLNEDKRFLQEELRRLSRFDDVIGAGGALREVMELVRNVAPRTSPVLLTGETGTGKEVIAHALHMLSPRRDGPFIKVNCGAIPESLVDSELFGHERGAFTGSVARHRGRFERADGGTIFLDEISELPLAAQIRLLRVLQESEIERVGGIQVVKLDFRVVAATNRDLDQLVAASRFRRDLYYRLSVFPIHLPPLRRRRGDIPDLVRHFVRQKCREMRLGEAIAMEPGVLEKLADYPWPGNVRELENAIERALITRPQGPLSFPFLDATSPRGAFAPAGQSVTPPVPLNRAMARHINEVLARVNGRVEGKGGAAELLGVKPSTLRKRMRKLGLAFGRTYPRAHRSPRPH